jgi:acetyl esterase/lipase
MIAISRPIAHARRARTLAAGSASWLAIVRWPAALAAIELALLLIVLGLGAAAVLAVLGGVEGAAGWGGLAALLAADAITVPSMLGARRLVLHVDGLARPFDLRGAASRYPRSHAVLPFLVLRRAGVHRVRGVVYASHDGRDLKLDVYLPASMPSTPRPAIIQVHGGGFCTGSRREAMPLLTHLAVNGWVGFSIDYRLSPKATFPDHLVDVKRAIAWVREQAPAYGVDDSFIAITGGSAGATLATLAALTPGDRTLQPGFERAATSVAALVALVALYGAYDLLEEDGAKTTGLMRALERLVFKARRAEAPARFREASPLYRVQPAAPPAFVIHGDIDTIIPAEQARRFVRQLRGVSRNPVLHAQVPGGHHIFDAVPSWRTIAVVEAIERFLWAVRHDSLGADYQHLPSAPN